MKSIHVCLLSEIIMSAFVCVSCAVAQSQNDVEKAKSLGNVCELDIQCQKRLSMFSACIHGACTCKNGTHLKAGKCYKTAIIGQSCSTTKNCYLGPDTSISNQAYCVEGFCQCSLMHSPRNAGTRCLKDAMLGEQCEDDEQCTGENTQCNSVCHCHDGYMLHPDENRCLKAAVAFNDSCEIEDQCTANLNGSTCMDQHCSCQWGFHMSDGRCQYSERACSSNQECLTEANESGKCIGRTCTCIGCISDYIGDNSGVTIFATSSAATTTSVNTSAATISSSLFSTTAFLFFVTFVASTLARS